MKGTQVAPNCRPIAVASVSAAKDVCRLLVSYSTLARLGRRRRVFWLEFKICALVSILCALDSLPASESQPLTNCKG